MHKVDESNSNIFIVNSLVFLVQLSTKYSHLVINWLSYGAINWKIQF